MKKIFFAMIALMSSFALSSCDDDFNEGIAGPLTSPEETPQTVAFGNGAITEVTTINLADVAAETVQVCRIQAPTVTDANATLTGYTITIDDVVYELSADGFMSTEDLTTAIESLYGKRPVERTVNAVVRAYFNANGQSIVTVSDEFKVKVVPAAPHISENYYIVGGTLDWAGSAASKEQKFSHSSADVYEDPIFTIVIPAVAGGDTWFAIGDDEALDAITNNNDWSKLLGTTSGNGNSGTSGQLDVRTKLSDDGSFCVPAGNKLIKVTINMMEYTYTVEPVNISDAYYLIGGPGEWTAESAWTMQFSHSAQNVFDDPVFTYTFASTGGEMWFAFGDADAISAVADGTWNQLFGTTGASEDLSGSFDRRYNLDGDHSFHVDGSALYYRFSVNMSQMTYTITPLSFAEYIWQAGNGNGWGNPAAPLYGPAGDGKYTGYMYLDGEFKFRSGEDNWDAPDWGTGGSEGTLAEQAGNLSAATGYYKVDVDLAALTYALTPITSISIIGTVNGSWDTDTDLSYNAASGAWEVTATLNAGEMKFRANHDWGINWGGESLNDFTQGGANYVLAESGTYFIQLFAFCDTKAYCVITKK